MGAWYWRAARARARARARAAALLTWADASLAVEWAAVVVARLLTEVGAVVCCRSVAEEQQLPPPHRLPRWLLIPAAQAPVPLGQLVSRLLWLLKVRLQARRAASEVVALLGMGLLTMPFVCGS